MKAPLRSAMYKVVGGRYLTDPNLPLLHAGPDPERFASPTEVSDDQGSGEGDHLRRRTGTYHPPPTTASEARK